MISYCFVPIASQKGVLFLRHPVDQVLHGEMKERIHTSYYDRLKKLLKSKLNAGNLVKAINCWAVASVRYSAAIVDWTKEGLR